MGDNDLPLTEHIERMMSQRDAEALGAWLGCISAPDRGFPGSDVNVALEACVGHQWVEGMDQILCMLTALDRGRSLQRAVQLMVEYDQLPMIAALHPHYPRLTTDFGLDFLRSSVILNKPNMISWRHSVQELSFWEWTGLIDVSLMYSQFDITTFCMDQSTDLDGHRPWRDHVIDCALRTHLLRSAEFAAWKERVGDLTAHECIHALDKAMIFHRHQDLPYLMTWTAHLSDPNDPDPTWQAFYVKTTTDFIAQNDARGRDFFLNYVDDVLGGMGELIATIERNNLHHHNIHMDQFKTSWALHFALEQEVGDVVQKSIIKSKM